MINHLTLKGVIQSPGRAGEDTRDGVTHGGWGSQSADDQVVAATYARVEEGRGLQLLLGRCSYEGMLRAAGVVGSRAALGLSLSPAVDRGLTHSDLSGNHTDRAAQPDKLHNSPTKLWRIRPRHNKSPFLKASILTNQVQKTGTRSACRDDAEQPELRVLDGGDAT